MPDRPDLRKIAADIREALESYPREALADILTYVFQAYVVEGMPTVAATQPERLQELEGLSFADVISALQTRLDLPELSLFEVSGGRVSVRVGGQLVPIGAGRAGIEPPAAASAPLAASPPLPGVRVEEVPSSQLRPPRAAAAPPAEAPPPRRGLTTQAGAATPPASAAQPATQAGPARDKAQPAAEAEPEDTGSKRFSLLDLD